MDEEKDFRSARAVQHYRRTADVLIPGRQHILSTIGQLVETCVVDEPRVLDLGCGYGDLTAKVLAARPKAAVYLVDYSDEMIRLATERFKDSHNAAVIKYDLNQGLPPSLMNESFDAVVSCFALHHIGFECSASLYETIQTVLGKGGVFIIGDRFKDDSPLINQWEFDHWVSWMVERIKSELHKERTFEQVRQAQIESDRELGDKPCTIFEMSRDLIRSGFLHLDCVWKNLNLAILVASK